MRGKIIKRLTNIRYRRLHSNTHTARDHPDFEERSAIIEFDGNIPVSLAEKLTQELLNDAMNKQRSAANANEECDKQTNCGNQIRDFMTKTSTDETNNNALKCNYFSDVNNAQSLHLPLLITEDKK